jgi:hypothetical protein
VISQLYYYLVAAAAVGLLVFGGIQLVEGLRQVVLPRAFESRHNGLFEMLQSLAFIIPGSIAARWNLREARARESVRITPITWMRALYFMLVSLFAVAFVYFGAITLLHGLAAAVWQQCGTGFGPQPLTFAQPTGYFEQVLACFPGHIEALRSALDGLIVVAVAGTALRWHLGRLRRETAGV